MIAHPGFYVTGDGGYRDEDGYLYVMGRIDDVINVAGHRLSTGQMEEVLASHPAVAECAVIGVNDDFKGQIPRGFVVLKAGVSAEPAVVSAELVQLIRDAHRGGRRAAPGRRRDRPAQNPVRQDPAQDHARHRRRRRRTGPVDDRGPGRTRRAAPRPVRGLDGMVTDVTGTSNTAGDAVPNLASQAAYLIEVAARAPSLHNTQPWRFKVGERAIELYADPSRQLREDPAGREMLISCGAALYGLRLGIRSLGYRSETDALGYRPISERSRPGSSAAAGPSTAGTPGPDHAGRAEAAPCGAAPAHSPRAVRAGPAAGRPAHAPAGRCYGRRRDAGRYGDRSRAAEARGDPCHLEPAAGPVPDVPGRDPVARRDGAVDP